MCYIPKIMLKNLSLQLYIYFTPLGIIQVGWIDVWKSMAQMRVEPRPSGWETCTLTTVPHTSTQQSTNLSTLSCFQNTTHSISYCCLCLYIDSVTIDKQTNQTIATLFTCNLYESADVRVFKPSLDCKALLGFLNCF